MRSLIARLALAMIVALCPLPSAAQSPRAPLVLAAASLQESLTEAANAWTARRHAKPVLSFAATSALARQVEAGAQADLFISADEEWMNTLASKSLIVPASRVPFLGNRLVLIAPVASRGSIAIRPGFPLARALGDNRLAIADPDAVPAGKYAKASLTKLGVWTQLEPKLARAENVRAALALVERGEAPYGIVYLTDARASKKVRVVGTFAANTHPAITYPVALLKSATSSDAEPFRRFLISPAGKAIFRRYGFSTR
jgi:molybdate transport system substrate-binding protein